MSVNEPGLGPDGVPALGGRSPYATTRQRFWVIGGVVIAFVIAIWLAAGFFTGHKRAPITTEHASSTGMPFTQPAEPKPAVQPISHPMSAPTMPKLAAFNAASKDNALEAPIFSTAGTAYQGGPGGQYGPGSGTGNAEKDDEFSAAMTASGVGGPAKAHSMKHPSLTVPAGLVIDCVLQTAINSELMGFVDCQLPSPVMSADGTVELMPKGTQVMGQIKSGLRRGQERLFILWVRARTPDQVTVNLASPAADELGRAGVTGYVNTHFWKMFWTAALYSVIQYGPQIAASALQNVGGNNNNTTYLNPSFLTPQQNLANTVLQEDLKIPPTLEKNQGDLVSIFVARDLDFSGVYDLQMTARGVNTCEHCTVPTWTTEKSQAKNR